MTTSDLQWFSKADLRQYKGEYVIIVNKQVVMHGTQLKQLVLSFRKRYPGLVPQIAKIPKEEVLVLRL